MSRFASSRLLWPLAVLAVALAPHLFASGGPAAFGEGWISDDTGALAYVDRAGPLADWNQPQYGMRNVRFWRPLVTTTLGLQERATGVSPAPLRAFNLAGHAAAALLCGLLALRLCKRVRGALAAGCLAALFPDVGGTVTWIVGRVDSQTVPLVLGAAWCAVELARRPAGAPRRGGIAWAFAGAALAFGACASKEIGFAGPLVGLALALGAAGPKAALRASAPLFAGAAIAFLWRVLAIDAWVGGYPAQAPGLRDVARATGLVLRLFAWPLAAIGLFGVLAAVASRAGGDSAAPPRAVAAPLLAAAFALAPLLQLLVDGVLEPQNRRVIFLADALVAVAVGVAFARVPVRAATRGLGGRLPSLALAVLALLALAARRGLDARADVDEWYAAAALAEAHVERDRAALAGVEPSDEPVLDATLPGNHAGAYCMAWGAADRFRAPFAATPRPVWPLRLMFQPAGPARERPRVTEPRDDLVFQFDGGKRLVPKIVALVDGRADGAIRLDEDVARGGGAVIELRGSFPADARLEALVYTELGYEAATLAPVGPAFGPPEPGPDGIASPAARMSIGQVLRAVEAASLGAALLQAADVGARRAYLELRIVDDARGIKSRPIAASRMIPLVWDADLPARLEAAE